jgi:ribosomal protein S14
MTKQISRLTNMNTNLVNALIAMGVGGKVSDKNNAEKEQEKENKNSNKRSRGSNSEKKECSYCKKTHAMAGKFCLARKCNAHLRPNNWRGAEIDE